MYSFSEQQSEQEARLLLRRDAPGGFSHMNTASLLLVDDDTALLLALAQTIALRMSGVQVETASSAYAALTLLQQREYDVIISDIKMPGMDGLALMGQIQHQFPEILVLLITGYREHDLAIQALRGGAYDYLSKPIDRDDLVAALQRALHTRQLRRQIAEQQHALERSLLSLEQVVGQRTHELVVANAAKDTLLSMVAHELTTPLTSVKGLTQMMERQVQRGDDGEKIAGTLVDVKRSLHRLEVLVGDLQDTSLIQTHHLTLHCTRCNLIELCQHILQEFQWSSGIAPLLEVHADQLDAEVDPTRMSQVLLNLLSNARKYSPPGTPITLTLDRRERQALLSVRDQGCGIAEGQLLRIYEPFYRVPDQKAEEEAPAGFGLGLFLARTLVEQHGGHLEVHSRVGRGSTFSVVLPLLAEEDRPF
jgi:signal transduction histidine kinase